MLLKSLQIQGFKTFADKLTINFDHGITGVVGPNGCGKSNVIDAIRWVLGEQRTRALRVENMVDVIFNGTKNRKMVSLAEATIVFENNKGVLPMEYNTVAVTRKLYRSGESEYYLNGVNCRLKDIHHLFLDTGIGTDSYSIIELNMVKDMLEDKENARKAMFEEAAGIAKYRVRRKESFRKLSDTEADLNRVEDILAEIESNLKQLERQAARTKQYYEQKERYKEISIRLTLHKFVLLEKKLDEILKKQGFEEDKIVAIETEVATLEAALEQDKLTVLNQEQALIVSRKKLADFRNTIAGKESERKLDQQRLNQLHIDQRRILLQNDQDKALIQTLQEELSQLKEQQIGENIQLEELTALVEEKLEKVTQLKIQLEAQKKQVNQAQNTQDTSKNTLSETEKRIDIANIQYKSLSSEIQRLNTSADEKRGEISAFAKNLEEIEVALETYKQNIEQLYEKEDQLNAQKIETEQSVNRQQQQILEQQRQLDAQSASYNLLKSMVDNLEGFPESVKFLKKTATNLSNCPLLSEVIFVDEQYKAALENVLATYLNYYIVPNKAVAWQSIQLLKEKEQGKVGFFSLQDVQKPQNYTAESLNIPQAIPALQVGYEVK